MYDVKTKELVATLKDAEGKTYHGYRHIEVQFKDGKPFKIGDQIGKGGDPATPNTPGTSDGR